MKRKITFNKSGSGSTSAKLVIPNIFLELMNIDVDNREINIYYKDNKIIIEKIEE